MATFGLASVAIRASLSLPTFSVELFPLAKNGALTESEAAAGAFESGAKNDRDMSEVVQRLPPKNTLKSEWNKNNQVFQPRWFSLE